MKPSFIVILTLILAALSMSACEKRKTLVELGNERQIMHIGNAVEPTEIDPHVTSGLGEYHLQMAVFEGLVAKHPQTLEAVPGVADRWEISEDKTVYTFHIRENARWSDGEKLTAYDFEYSWKRVLQPEIGCDYTTDFFVIKNAEAYYKGEIKDFADVGIKALDASHFQVTLNYPVPYFLLQMDNFPMYPVQKKTIEKFNAFKERGTRWTRPENFVGNGPFVIDKWIPTVVFSVKKNPYYWDSANVKLNEIHFYPYDNILLEERMFRSGQLHKTEFLPSEKSEKYKNSAEYYQSPFYAIYYYLLNNKVKPLDDVRVRKALAYSIDRESLVKNVTKGGQKPSYHYTPDNPFGFTAKVNFSYDVDLAKRLLSEAGYPEGKGFPKLELTYNTNADHLKNAQAIQQMWKKNLGVEISLRNLEWKVYLDARSTRNFQILRRSNVADILDPATFLLPMMTKDPMNDSEWGSARFDELMERSKLAKTQEERFAYFEQAEKILVDEMPVIPLYEYTTNNLVAPNVKGYYKNILDYHPYKYIYLEAVPKSGN